MAEHATFTNFPGCYTSYYNYSRRPANLHSLIVILPAQCLGTIHILLRPLDVTRNPVTLF